MVIERDRGPIASWWFESETEVNLEVSEVLELPRFLEKITTAAEVLENADLLYPAKIDFEDWVSFNQKNKEINRHKGPILSIDLDKGFKASDLPDFIMATLTETFHGSQFLFPLEIKVFGEGVLLDREGNKSLWPNVAWIHGAAFGVYIVDIITQSYAWMAFDLDGHPQDSVHQNNAPRLAAALANLTNALRVAPINVDPTTDFAMIDGYQVLNLFDSDGQPITLTKF